MKAVDLHLHPTYRCNLSCIHCYNFSGVKYEGPRLTPDQTVDLIEFFSSRYDCDVHLEGGELFLELDIMQAISALPPESLKAVTLTTNGTVRLHDPRILAALRSVARLRVSIEGHLEEQQQWIRGVSLKRVLDTAKFYQNAGASLALRMTMTAVNGGGLVPNALPSLDSAGFNRIQVYEYQAVGRGAENTDLIWHGTISPLLEQLRSHRPRTSASLSFMFPAKRIEEIMRHAAQMTDAGWTVSLPAPRPSLSIHPDGTVHTCPWADDTKQTDPITTIADISSIAMMIDSGELDHACDRCTAVILKREWV